MDSAPDKSAYTKLFSCLACGSSSLKPFLDLGAQPLANDFRKPVPDSHLVETLQARYPLALQHCGSCGHVMLTAAVDPAILYADYPYASGTSATLRRYFQDFVSRVERDTGIARMDVLEIASNDGSLLREFKARGHNVMGVDPAENLKPADVPTWTGLWNRDALAAAKSEYPRGFDVIVAQNVLGHVADPLGFLSLCREALAPEGRIYIQTSQARMLESGEFDTVYHEHLSYFTEESWYALARRADLKIDRMDVVDIHGGSWLLEMSDTRNDPKVFRTFDWRVSAAVQTAEAMVSTYRRAGYRVVGYGAAAKGMTFLNTVAARSRVHPEALDAAVMTADEWRARQSGGPSGPLGIEMIIDDSPLKVGRLCPGTGIPVVGSDVIATLPEKTLFVILAWNFAEEIKSRILMKRTETSGIEVVHGDDGSVTVRPPWKFMVMWPRPGVS